MNIETRELGILEQPHQLMHFTHLFLQNTYISLSILHIYSIKYSKPSHHQLDQYPALHHQPTQPPSSNQPPSSTHPSKSQPPSTRSIPIDQNHQNPLIKIIKNHQTQKKDSYGDWREIRAVAISNGGERSEYVYLWIPIT